MRLEMTALQLSFRCLLLATDGDLVGNHRAEFVAYSFNFGDFEASAAQVRQCFLQSAVELILELRRTLGRRQHASVHPVDLLAAGIPTDKANVRGRGRVSDRRLVAKPFTGSQQNE